ncbi:PHP domain-containing protein [Enterococcus rivorum]|uniref:hydrolase n=1 Tax=Enterococcus rivorum TaxID=762845 RepID=UPI00362990A7
MEAQKKNLEGIVISDHFGPYFVGGNLFQSFAGIANIRNIPDEINDIKIINGVEIDIIDKMGNLAFFDHYFPFDSSESVLERLVKKCSMIIASYHQFGNLTLTSLENTNMLISVLSNPDVHVLGHCDRIPGKFEELAVIQTAKKLNKVIELNTHSFNKDKMAQERIKRIAILCAENDTKVTIGSDAHFATDIGNFSAIKNMLTSISFPEELLINTSVGKIYDFLNQH